MTPERKAALVHRRHVDAPLDEAMVAIEDREYRITEANARADRYRHALEAIRNSLHDKPHAREVVEGALREEL